MNDNDLHNSWVDKLKDDNINACRLLNIPNSKNHIIPHIDSICNFIRNKCISEEKPLSFWEKICGRSWRYEPLLFNVSKDVKFKFSVYWKSWNQQEEFYIEGINRYETHVIEYSDRIVFKRIIKVKSNCDKFAMPSSRRGWGFCDYIIYNSGGWEQILLDSIQL